MIPRSNIEEIKLHHSAAVIEAQKINKRIRGRLSGPSRLAYVGAMAAAIADFEEDFSYLEIGVLFGGSMCLAMWGAKRGRFVGVDLFSWYGEEKDPCSGNVVSYQRAFNNVEDYSDAESLDDCVSALVKGSSHDTSVFEDVKALIPEVSLLLIDGDHTEDGVTRDFEMYSPLVKPGGVIAFDDYGGDIWKDVDRAVNKIHDPQWRHVGILEAKLASIYLLQRYDPEWGEGEIEKAGKE